MKKIDALLKKVEFFEKLAVYGDRETFLRALAQSAPLNDNVKERIESLIKDLSATKPDSTRDLQTRLMDFLSGVKSDPNELAQTVREAANAIPSSNREQASRALELAQMLQQNSTLDPAASNRPTQTLNTTVISEYPPIAKDQQEALGKIVSLEGLGNPLKVDGKFGPATKAALKAFKAKFNLERLSDGDALVYAKMLADTSSKYK
jgi:hypothetical protein